MSGAAEIGQVVAGAHGFPVAVNDLIAWVACETGTPSARIRGARGSADTARARFAVMWGARTILSLTLPQIGRRLGRNHATVSHGVRRAEQLIATDPAFRRLAERMRAQFGRRA